MNIVYSTSDYFVKPTITSIVSLVNHNEVTNIIILYSDLSYDSIELIKRIVKKCNLIFLKCDDIIKDKLSHLKLKKVRGNWNTYLRVFIPSLFPEFDRILYIDSDTLINGDISNFYNLNFDDNYFAASIDYAAKSKYSNIESKEILDKGEYYNCGILLLNNSKLVEINFTDQILSFLEKTKLKFRVADQSIINYLYYNKFKTVDIGYNFYSSLHYFNSIASKFVLGVDFTNYHKNKDEIKIIHFIGHWFERPWFKTHYSIFSKTYLNVFSSCGFTKNDLLETPKYSKHYIYDYTMLFLRKGGFLTTEFYFRYLVMQKLKAIIKIER